MGNNTMISSVGKVNFVPTLDSVSFQKARATAASLRHKIKEAKQERLNAMENFLYHNMGTLFPERDLAAAFDLDFRDVVQARLSLSKGCYAEIFCNPHDLTSDLQLVISNKIHLIKDDEEGEDTGEYDVIGIKIYGRKIAVMWQAMDENDQPIPGRANFREENQYLWMFKEEE